MKKEIKTELYEDLTEGVKGLKISLIILALLTVGFSYILLSNLGLDKTIDILIRMPNGDLDLMAVFAGVLIFIAIPFTTSIYIKKLI